MAIASNDKFQIEFDEGAIIEFVLNDNLQFKVVSVSDGIEDVRCGDFIVGANGTTFAQEDREEMLEALETLLNSDDPVHFNFAREEIEIVTKTGALANPQKDQYEFRFDQGIVEFDLDAMRGFAVISVSGEMDVKAGDLIVGAFGAPFPPPSDTDALRKAMEELLRAPDAVVFDFAKQDTSFKPVGTYQSGMSTKTGKVTRTPKAGEKKDLFKFGEVKKPEEGGEPLPAHIAAQEKAVITRLHVMEYLSGREWWYDGQNNLCFTVVLWIVFLLIMYLRTGVEVSYDLHQAVAQHMENIVAHPHLSGISLRTLDDQPLPCKCACQSSTAGLPSGPCDPHAAESLDFLGGLPTWMLPVGSARLPHFSHGALHAANIDPSSLGDRLYKGNDDIEEVTWNSLVEPEQVWFWVEHGFIPNVWMPRSLLAGNNTLQGLIASRNLIIGGVRARQERAEWSQDCEKKVSEELDAAYGMPCRGWDDATGYYGPSLSNNSRNTNAFRPSQNNERFYDALLDVELPASFALETSSFCRKYGWIDSATRTLELKGVALNADVGMFAIVRIHFEFLAGGGLDKRVDVHTIHATGQKLEFSDIIPELIWAVMILLLLRQELSQLAYEACQRRCLDYWLDLWCVVDWISILVGLTIAAFWFWQISAISVISDDVAALDRAPFTTGFPSDLDGYQTKWQKILDDASSIYERKQYYQLALFWYTMIITGRFLKGFLSQAKLAMLQLTLGHTFWDVTHLLVFFLVIFMNFMLGGHILFGPELWDWSTLVKSAGTSLRMLLGDFAFDDMYEIAPVSATIWFWFFLLSMTFILMNFCFAIIGDYFHVFRRSIGATPTLWDDIIVSLKEQWWRLKWRREQFRDAEDRGDYCSACCYSPYYGVLESLMDAAQVPTSLERDARHSCLGVKLGRRHMEALSVHALTAATNQGFVEVKENDLQRMECELQAAAHLLDMTAPMVGIETKLKNESQLTLIRHLVTLLQTHRMELDAHCTELEKDITLLANADKRDDGRDGLFRYLESLEESVKGCLTEFERLKATGVKSLAPAPHSLPRPGTLAAREAQQMSMIGPGALLKAIETQTQNLLRLPPEPPDMNNPAHRNALVGKSPHTMAMLRKRRELQDMPTSNLLGPPNIESDVTLMLEDETIPEQMFMADTFYIKDQQDKVREKEKELEDKRRFEEMKRTSRAPGQKHDDDDDTEKHALLALEGGQSKSALRQAASRGNDEPRALMDDNKSRSNTRPAMQPIMDQGSNNQEDSNGFEISIGEGIVVFKLNHANECVVESCTNGALGVARGDIVIGANGQRFPEALRQVQDGQELVEVTFASAEQNFKPIISDAPGVFQRQKSFF